MEIAFKGIDLLEQLHSTGFVHGDIHNGNILFSLTPSMTLHLIDFGFASPFLDVYGRHIVEADTLPNLSPYAFAILNLELLSPWHLKRGAVDTKRYRPTRRDDLFRFAELLFELASAEYSPRRKAAGDGMRRDAKLKQLIKFKESEAVKEIGLVPVEFKEFYEYVLGLRFGEMPEYGRWKSVFSRGY